MERIPFPQRLKIAEVNIQREYERLYNLFYHYKMQNGARNLITLRDYCAYSFLKLPFRDTCLSLDDFDESHGFNFEQNPSDFNIDYLVNFCEYSYNLVCCSERFNNEILAIELYDVIQFYTCQITNVIEKIGYMWNYQGNYIIFIPKDQVVISVAEKVDPNLSPRVIEYNHHSLKGNLERKKDILRAFAHNLEPQLNKIKQVNSSLENNLSCLFNNLDLRHNNVDQDGGNHYKPFVANMKKEEIEQWYDTIYQLCMLAFLELDYFALQGSIAQLRENFHPPKS